MDYIRDQLEIFMNKLQELKQIYINELSQCPSGSLINNNLHGKPAYYHAVLDSDRNYKRTRINLDNPLVSELARKEYLTKSLNPIDHNIKVLDRALKSYYSLDPADIISMANRAYRLLPENTFFGDISGVELWDIIQNLEELTDEQIKYRCSLHREWADEEYARNTHSYTPIDDASYFPNESQHITSFGLRVRSRGELIIAELLYQYGIPFRYDQIITLSDGLTASPDFTFQDKNMKEFYLEYAGMMDDPDYVKSFLNKRNRYELSGIVSWENMYYVYSTNNGFNVGEIKSVIQNWIVPKL